MRALLILNEKSRRGERDGGEVCRQLASCGIDCVRDMQARDVDAVIAAGGDGTIISSVGEARDRNVPLGIVPLGTFNDLARSLGLPLEISDACAAIKAGKTRTIDLGRVNGKYFVNEASIGISARVARRQTPEVKQRFGFLGVISTTIQSLRQTRPFVVDVQYDGKRERFRSVQLTIANNGHFGGIFDRDDASIDDGWLDLYSVEIRNWLQALRVAGKVVRRDPTPGEGLRTRRSTKFSVTTRHAHHIAADGEPAGTTPAVFELLPKAVRIIIP